MPGFYDRASATASRLLKKYNQAEYILSRAGSVTPAANPWDEPQQSPPQAWTLSGISEAVEPKYVDGDTIKVTDRQIMVAAFDDKPLPGDVLTINGEVATVLDIKPITERGCAWLIFVKG